MSDKSKNNPEVLEKGGISRRNFLGASAVTGAAVAATAFGGAVMSRESWAAAVKDAQQNIHVAPGELDDYYGFWSGGHQGEVRVLGIPSMRELMRIPVFNVDSASGWGLTNESRAIMGDSAKFLNGDCHHPHISMTDGKYDGKYVFINDKANTRVARIRLDIMKCDKMLTVPNCQAIHGLRLQKVPYTKYVFANAEFVIPHPNDGKVFDLQDENSYTMYNVIDAEKMEMAFQIIVDGNLDNTDMDYTGRFTASTCYNSEKAYDLGGMMRNERDWVVVFDIEAAEKAVKAGKFITLGDSKVPVLDGRKKGDPLHPGAEEPARLQHLVRWQVLHRQRQAVADRHHDRDRQAARPVRWQAEGPARHRGGGRGTGPRPAAHHLRRSRQRLHHAVHRQPGGEVEHGRRGTRLQGREGRVHQAEARCALPAGPHSCLALRNQRSRRQVAGGAVQVLQGPLPVHRAAAPRERPADRHLR